MHVTVRPTDTGLGVPSPSPHSPCPSCSLGAFPARAAIHQRVGLFDRDRHVDLSLESRRGTAS
jgi:hypothetical protein